jgi:hypothetical protein
MAAKMIKTHTTTATLMPAFALVERPLLGEEVGMIEAGRVAVFED